jgi:hypothetical protein
MFPGVRLEGPTVELFREEATIEGHTNVGQIHTSWISRSEHDGGRVVVHLAKPPHAASGDDRRTNGARASEERRVRRAVLAIVTLILAFVRSRQALRFGIEAYLCLARARPK